VNSTTALPRTRLRITAGILADRAAVVRDVMLPYQWEALQDRVAGAEPSGCMHNLRLAAGEATGTFHGLFWQDSDLAKWIEAVGFRLASYPDATLEATVDEVVRLLSLAQAPDGYLDTYFQLVEPQKRFTNLRDCHELYCAGHLLEAAVAHFEATAKTTLLDVARRLADLLVRTFGPGPSQLRGYCGHEEIELALIKLARVTGDERYTDLAAWFVDERGRTPNWFEQEAARRPDDKLPWYVHHDGLAYWQAHRRPAEQTEPVGHAVRAMYLYSAMADLALERGDTALRDACFRIWREVEHRHLFLVGGVGADGPGGEKFSEPYDLPSDRAYAETCAAVGLVFFARRMLDLSLEARFGDVLERALFNNVLAGMSLDGRSFFYVNPLEVRPREARRRYDSRHVKTTRQPWFGCACCPPNIARLVMSLGDYLVSHHGDTIALHVPATMRIETGSDDSAPKIDVRTEYPWDGRVLLTFHSTAPTDSTVALRIPGWCRSATLVLPQGGSIEVAEAMPSCVDGYTLSLKSGYLHVTGRWSDGAALELRLAMPTERVYAHPSVAATAGQVALQRGPVVYCFEEVDNGSYLAALRLPRSARITDTFEDSLLGGCTVLDTRGRRLCPDRAPEDEPLYRNTPHATTPAHLRAVPYALWANRGEGEMRVWIHETEV
jgi:DUF1680 family protein